MQTSSSVPQSAVTPELPAVPEDDYANPDLLVGESAPGEDLDLTFPVVDDGFGDDESEPDLNPDSEG
jgi:hypothetical protein